MVLPLVGSLLDLAKPWPMKFVVDELVPSGGKAVRIFGLSGIGLAGAAAAAFVGITALSGLVSVRSTVASARLVQRVTLRIRRQVFEHLHRLAIPFHQSSNTGELLERLLGDVDGVRRLIFTSWISMIERTVLFGGGLIAMALVNVRFALLAVVPLPVYLVVVARTSRKLKAVTRTGRERRSKATAIASESLNRIRIVKAYANEKDVLERFGRESEGGEMAGAEAARISARLSLYSDVLSGMGVALVLFFGASQALSGDLSPGFLVVVTSYAGSLFRPLRKMSKEGGYLSSAVVSAERLMEVLELEPEPQEGDPPPLFRGHVAFEGVHFAHEGGVKALRGLSFEVPAGCLAVLAGPNGAGKSTAFSVLLRLLTPEKGKVSIDGE
ncbi:MAG: ABC transporter transmembrane domain-containing protein, partial [Actinomycetota bacterium]